MPFGEVTFMYKSFVLLVPDKGDSKPPIIVSFGSLDVASRMKVGQGIHITNTNTY